MQGRKSPTAAAAAAARSALEGDANAPHFRVLAVLVAILAVLGHVRPGVAYPLTGLALLLGWGLALCEGVLLAGRAGLDLRHAAPAGAALTILVAWCWGRTALSTVPTDGAETLTSLLEGLAVFWLGAIVVAAERRTSRLPASFPAGRVLVWLFAAVAAALALHAAVQYHVTYPAQYAHEKALYDAERRQGAPADPVTEGVIFALSWRRVGSTFGSPNVLGGFLAMCVPLLAVAPWTVGRRRRPMAAVACGAAGIAVVYAVWRTGSAGGGLTLLVALALAAAGLGVRHWRTGAWLAVAAVLAVFALAQQPAASRAADGPTSATAAVAPAHFSFVDHLAAKSDTLRQRLYYLRTAWQLWRRAPVVGHGLGAYGRLYGQARVAGAGESQCAHNVAAQMAVETGSVGLAIGTVFVGLLAWRWGRALRLLARGASPVPAALGAAAAVFMLDSMGDLTFYYREALLGFCLIAGGLAATPPETEPERPASARGAMWSARATAIVGVLGLGWVGVPAQMERHNLDTARDALREVAAAEAVRATSDRDWWADRAWRAAGNAIWWQPRNAWAWQMRSGVARAMRRPQQAEGDLRHAVALHPASARLRADLADLTWRLHPGAEGMAEAMALTDAAVALHPLKSTYHEQRARLLAAQGRHDEALAEAREAVRLAFMDDEKASSRDTLASLGKSR